MATTEYLESEHGRKMYHGSAKTLNNKVLYNKGQRSADLNCKHATTFHSTDNENDAEHSSRLYDKPAISKTFAIACCKSSAIKLRRLQASGREEIMVDRLKVLMTNVHKSNQLHVQKENKRLQEEEERKKIEKSEKAIDEFQTTISAFTNVRKAVNKFKWRITRKESFLENKRSTMSLLSVIESNGSESDGDDEDDVSQFYSNLYSFKLNFNVLTFRNFSVILFNIHCADYG